MSVVKNKYFVSDDSYNTSLPISLYTIEYVDKKSKREFITGRLMICLSFAVAVFIGLYLIVKPLSLEVDILCGLIVGVIMTLLSLNNFAYHTAEHGYYPHGFMSPEEKSNYTFKKLWIKVYEIEKPENIEQEEWNNTIKEVMPKCTGVYNFLTRRNVKKINQFLHNNGGKKIIEMDKLAFATDTDSDTDADSNSFAIKDTKMYSIIKSNYNNDDYDKFFKAFVQLYDNYDALSSNDKIEYNELTHTVLFAHDQYSLIKKEYDVDSTVYKDASKNYHILLENVGEHALLLCKNLS